MSIKEQYGCGWETQGKDYLEQKVDVMVEFGLTDEEALREYLVRETANDPTEKSREMHIDRLVRTIIDNYYDGDRTFVKDNSDKCKTYYDTLRESTKKHKILYEKIVIRYIGKKGICNLIESNLISPYYADNGILAYTIADNFNPKF